MHGAEKWQKGGFSVAADKIRVERLAHSLNDNFPIIDCSRCCMQRDLSRWRSASNTPMEDTGYELLERTSEPLLFVAAVYPLWFIHGRTCPEMDELLR